MESVHVQDVSKQLEIIRARPELIMQGEAIKEYKSAVKEVAKSKALEIIEMLEGASVGAMGRMVTLTKSVNEEIGYKASAFIIDHVIGKAPQHTTSKNVNVNIDIVAD